MRLAARVLVVMAVISFPAAASAKGEFHFACSFGDNAKASVRSQTGDFNFEVSSSSVVVSASYLPTEIIASNPSDINVSSSFVSFVRQSHEQGVQIAEEWLIDLATGDLTKTRKYNGDIGKEETGWCERK